MKIEITALIVTCLLGMVYSNVASRQKRADYGENCGWKGDACSDDAPCCEMWYNYYADSLCNASGVCEEVWSCKQTGESCSDEDKCCGSGDSICCYDTCDDGKCVTHYNWESSTY